MAAQLDKLQDGVCHPISHTINNFLVSANWVRIPVFSFQLTPGFCSSVLAPILWEISYLPRTDATYYPGRSRVTRLVYSRAYTMCYSVCVGRPTLLKVVGYYELSVLSMSVMGFQKKVWMGVGGVSSFQFFWGYLEFV